MKNRSSVYRRCVSLASIIASSCGLAMGIASGIGGSCAVMAQQPDLKYLQLTVSNPELSLYRVIYSRDSLPVYGSTAVGQNAWYDYSNADSIGSYSKIGYYLQMDRKSGETEWILTMTPKFGKAANKLGVSLSGNSGEVTKVLLTGSTVYACTTTSAVMPFFSGITADANGVKTMTNASIVLEMWPFNYSGSPETSIIDQNGNTVALVGGAGSYDWNDTIAKDPSGNNTGNHACYQIHLYSATPVNGLNGQSLISLSRLYRSNEAINAGLGNDPSNAPDWTIGSDASRYNSDGRTLQVLVLPDYSESARILNATQSGAWSSADAWLDNTGAAASTVPSSASPVYINYGTGQLNAASTIASLNVDPYGELNLESGADLTVTGTSVVEGTMRQAAGASFTSNGRFTVGLSGNGVFEQTGGTTTAKSGVYVANSANATGILNQSGGVFNQTGGDLYVANAANTKGELTISGGTLNPGVVNIAVQGTGTLNLYGTETSTVLATSGSYFCIGNNSSGSGTVNQYGGAVSSVWITLAHRGTGEYNLYDGLIRCTGTIQATSSDPNRSFQIGDRDNSTCTFNVYGGTLKSDGYLTVARATTGSLNKTDGKTGGILNLYDGAVTVAKTMIVADMDKATGEFKVSGGTATIGGELVIGNAVGSKGAFTLSGGTVKSGNLYIGKYGTGSLVITGGNLTCGNFDVGWNSNTAAGTVDMWGGTVTATGYFAVGNASTSTGTFNQYGGDVQASWYTSSFNDSATGTYNLYGGSLSVKGDGRFQIGNGSANGATFNISGGEVSVAGTLSINAKSSLNFESGVKGFGSFEVNNLTQSGAINVSVGDGLSFLGPYSTSLGTTLMTLTGTGTPVATTPTGSNYTAVFDSTTKTLNFKFTTDAVGNLSMTCGSLDFDDLTSGWVTTSDFGGNDPFVLTLGLSGLTDMTSFLTQLNSDLALGASTPVYATQSDENEVQLTGIDTALINSVGALTWDFSAAGYSGVSLDYVRSNQVPEPSAWILMVVGLFGVVGFVRKRFITRNNTPNA